MDGRAFSMTANVTRVYLHCAVRVANVRTSFIFNIPIKPSANAKESNSLNAAAK